MASTTYCVVLAFMLAIAVVQAKNAKVPMVALETGNAALMDVLKDPNAMLATLENMVRSGETPAFDLITTIKSLIRDEVMPSLEDTQVAAALDTTNLLNAIQSCNNASKTTEGAIEATTGASVDNSRSLHAACREAEKTLYDHNLTHSESYCVRLGKFLHGAERLEIAAGLTRASSVQHVKWASSTNMCSRTKVTELDNGCTASEAELADKKIECSAAQQSFESEFCIWKDRLEANCKELDRCHSMAVTAYNNHVDKTRTLVQKWNVETAALQKILCYCDVWLIDKDEGDNRSQHNATQFEVCQDATHVPDTVNYGSPAEKVTCLLTSVANYPGTSGFVTQEYGSFINYVESVVPCTQGTTAVPTSTVAPPFRNFSVQSSTATACPNGQYAVDTESLCQQAAAFLGKNYAGNGSWSDHMSNCQNGGISSTGPTDTLFFNTGGSLTAPLGFAVCSTLA